MTAIAMNQVVKRYGRTSAVAGVDLTVPAGALLGLIGPNGAGKSTTLEMAATLIRPTEGTIEVLGHDVVSDTREVRRRTGFMPDHMGFYDDLSVDEYLRFFAAAHGIGRAERGDLVDGLLELVDLTSARGARVADLSRGMAQRLGVARVLVHDPEVLLLDEPASGLDPAARTELLTLLRQLHTLGKTIVITSHILGELESICSLLAMMVDGRIAAVGTAEELRDRSDGGRVLQVRFAEGTIERFTVVDDEEQEALLRRLLDDERRVLEYRRVDGGLDALFRSPPAATTPRSEAPS